MGEPNPLRSSMKVTGHVLRFGLLALALSHAPDLAAQVTRIDVQPTSLPNLRAGEQREILATAMDARGGVLFDASFTWVSSDPSVARVRPDPSVAGVGTVTGVANGLAIITVRVGSISQTIAVNVTGAAPQEPPDVPEARDELPDTVMAAGVVDRAQNLTARVRALPFQSAPACASAFFVGSDGLVLTTYRAIRGADRLELELPGQTVTNVQVAAYSVPNDVAVLRLPGVTKADSLSPAPRVVDQTVVWAFGYPDCGGLTRTRLRVAGQGTADGRPIVRLSGTLSAAERGAPLLTQQGAVMAVAAQDATALPGPSLADLIAEARTNVRLRALLTAQDVGRRENHLYGSLAISSSAAGAAARVTPVESWHWEGLAAEGQTPFTFTGAAGRYRVELVQNGQIRASTEAVVRPGEVQPVSLTLPAAAAAEPTGQPPQMVAQGGGGFPVGLVLLGLAGAGAGAFLLLGGGDDNGGETCPTGTTGTPPNCTPISTTGGITITVPNP